MVINGEKGMDDQVQILDESVGVSLRANALKKSMNPPIFPAVMGIYLSSWSGNQFRSWKTLNSNQAEFFGLGLVGLVWFLCRLFDAKSCLYIHIK